MESPKEAAKALLEALGLPSDDIDDERAHEIHAAFENLGAACEGYEEDADSEEMEEESPKKPKVGLLLSLGGKK